MGVHNPLLPRGQDEGTTQGNFHTLNATGAGITLSVSAGVATINVPGGGGGSAAFTAATITVPYDIHSGQATVVDAAISATSKIMIAWGAYLDTNENVPDMDSISFTAIPAAGSMTVRVSAADLTSRVGGTYSIIYLIG